MKHYKHYVWNPFASMQFHLFIFDYGKLSRRIIWKNAFGLDYNENETPSIGECYFINDHSIELVAVGLSKSEDNSIDANTIVHECTHAADEYFKILKMSMHDGSTTHEFRSNICASLVCKIIQLLIHLNININYDKFDQLGLLTVMEKVGNKYVHVR